MGETFIVLGETILVLGETICAKLVMGETRYNHVHVSPMGGMLKDVEGIPWFPRGTEEGYVISKREGGDIGN